MLFFIVTVIDSNFWLRLIVISSTEGLGNIVIILLSFISDTPTVISDHTVTCPEPIPPPLCRYAPMATTLPRLFKPMDSATPQQLAVILLPTWVHEEPRSEERRVGKECRSLWSPYQTKKK